MAFVWIVVRLIFVQHEYTIFLMAVSKTLARSDLRKEGFICHIVQGDAAQYEGNGTVTGACGLWSHCSYSQTPSREQTGNETKLKILQDYP